MIEVKGKAGIAARVLADSINKQGNRLTTFEIEVPRIVWAEFLTHGMLCRNAASSRAIPFNKMVEQLIARPVRFGEANKGMQDKGRGHDAPVLIPQHLWSALNEYFFDNFGEAFDKEDAKNDDGQIELTAFGAWDFHRFLSVEISKSLNNAKYHKQVYNRPTEAHQMIKAVVSATEYDNFFWLRDDGAADPTLAELAHCMKEARNKSVPELLLPGEWHLPYVDIFRDEDGVRRYAIYSEGEHEGDNGQVVLTTEDAIKVSAARCAAVSFRNEDYGLEKCLEVYDRLIGDERKHASAFQHQATPMHEFIYEHGWSSDYIVNNPTDPSSWEPGISHMDRDGNLWSAQFKGWIMNRKLIPGENYVAPAVDKG